MKKEWALLGIFTIILSLTLATVHAEDTNLTIPTGDFSKNLEKTLDKEVQLPESAQWIARFIFGAKESEKLTISTFMVLLSLWTFVFLITANILELTPLFDRATRWIGAACITIIGAMSGILQSVTFFLFSIGQGISFIDKWSAGALLFSLVILVALGIIVSKITKNAREHREITESKEEGLKKGVILGFMARMREGFNLSKP